MVEGQNRRHHHRRRSPFVTFLRSYWVELLIVLALALTIFLFFERLNIRGSLLAWGRAAAIAVQSAISGFITGVITIRSRWGLSELLAIPLFFSVLIAVVWRVRWRLARNPALTSTLCPRCGGEMHRVHRHTLDHVVRIFVPVRRYRCHNRECRWSGLRVEAARLTMSGSVRVLRRWEIIVLAIILVLLAVFVAVQIVNRSNVPDVSIGVWSPWLSAAT